MNEILESFAQDDGIPGHRRPRPCDVFDTIVAIGAGGWLAILPGRFRLDISSCLSGWRILLQRIAPKSMTEELRLRLLQHCYFDIDRLVEEVDLLTQVYGIGDGFFVPDTEGARTRRVFVAALASDAIGYDLFRSYKIPKSAKVLGGPKNRYTSLICGQNRWQAAAR